MKKNEEFQKQNPYQSDKLAKIPSWIKILLLKYWAAAAAFYFFAVANPIAQNEDQYYVWVSFGLGIFLEYIVKTLVRFMIKYYALTKHNQIKDILFQFNKFKGSSIIIT